MRISIILPSLTEHLLADALSSLLRHAKGIDLEIVVISQFVVHGDHIVHVPETERKGVCHAHQLGYAASTGDIIMAMTEDSLALPRYLDDIAVLIEQAERTHFPFIGGLHRPDVPYFGTTFGRYFAYFPVASRASIEAIGGWLSAEFRGHYGDSDLSLRAWLAGGHCALLAGDRLYSNRKHVKHNISEFKLKTRLQDFDTIVAKYYDRLGAEFELKEEDISINARLELLDNSTFNFKRPLRIYLAEGHRAGGRRLYTPEPESDEGERPFVIYWP